MIALLLALAAAAADAPPPSFIGAWEVEHVAVDAADQPHWSHRPDDPYLMGRELIIEADAVRSRLGKEVNCQPAGWQAHPATWGELIDAGFPRSGNGGTTPADFGLKVSPRARVTAYSLCPIPAARRRPGVQWVWQMYDVWLVQQAPDRLVMHLNDSVMLILARRSPDARPRASFACDRAATSVEKAICGSFNLAALDRSLALAWRRSAKGREVVAAQKAWLRSRDACGGDEACLEEKMTARIGELKN
jgi:hypothetical protein